MPCRPCAPRYTAEDWEHVFDHYAWKTNVFGNNVYYALGFQLLGHTPRTIFNMHRGAELVWNAEDLVIVKVIVRYNMRVQQGEACSRNFQPQCRLLPKELQGRHVEVPVYEKIAASRWRDCAHTPRWEEDYVPHKEWFLHMDYDKVKNLTPLSCCFPWAPQPTNVKARAAAFTACRSRSPRGGSSSSLAPTPTVVPSMEQETPTPASPTPFLPMPKSAAATQLDTEQEEVPAWFNYSPTSPADDMQEDDDDDGLQQQLQRAEHLTMTLERVNVRDSDSEVSGISDEDDEEEPDDKMSQKDEDQDEHQDQDEWRWMPLESGRWQGAQLLQLERQWQDAGFPKLGTQAGDWFHTQITAAETAYVTATGIYENMPDPHGGIAAGLSRTRQQKTRSRMRTRFKRSRIIGLPFRTRGSMKATKRLAPVHRMHSSGTYTYTQWVAAGYIAAQFRRLPRAPKFPTGQRWYNYRGQWLKVTFNDGIEWWTDDPCTQQALADVKDWFLGLEKVKN